MIILNQLSDLFFIGRYRRLKLFALAMTHIVEERKHAEIPSGNILISSTSEPEPLVSLMMPTMLRQQS